MLGDFAAAVRDLGVVRHLTARLDEEDTEVGDGLMHRLIACFDTPRLRSLSVEGHVELVTTFEMLAAWPGAAELTRLDFGFVWNLPGDDVLRVLADSPYLGRLAHLRLYLCEGFTTDGARVLVDSPRLPALRFVYLGEDENEVPEAALDVLRERFAVGHAP